MKSQGSFDPPEIAPDAVIVHIGDDAGIRASSIAAGLRADGLAVLVAPAGRSMRAQMRYSNSLNARYALIIGERELESGEGSLRPLQEDVNQSAVSLDVEAIAKALRAT